MKNNQLFPFERNRYYAGKVLTSTDFIAEQLYMNHKRRFINHVMYGSGIVCGLSVFNLDDLSILVESGVAIDAAGWEIVVEAAVVKKLSAIEGFDELTGDKATLCLRYQEEEVHPVYCAEANNEQKEYEYNRIKEGYELYLLNEDKRGVSEEMGEEFILEEKLLEDEDYTLFLRIPAAVPKGKAVKLACIIRKNSDAEKALSFQASIQFPVFYDEQGRHELEIDIQNLNLKQGEEIEKEYWMNVEYTDVNETTMIARKDSLHIKVGDDEVEAIKDMSFKILLVEISADALAIREVGKRNLEMKNRVRKDNLVRLAEFTLIRTETSYLISGICEQGVKTFIAVPGDAALRKKYLSYFKSSQRHTGEEAVQAQTDREGIYNAEESSAFMANGRIEIPLDVNMKKGDICYSEEIMHGLGKGNVYVEAGIEYLEEDLHLHKSTRNTVYGDSSLFPNPEYMELQTAVKVMNDKGSFQVAAKLLGEQKSIVIQVNWVAVKFTSIKDAVDVQEEDDRSIIPRNPTVRLKVKESHFFDVEFKNMPPSRLSYELTENGSGEISNDGIYTAPAREGVYEIHIYCTDMPKISTYVYAIVSR